MNKYMDLSAISYIPILAISQAEMLALTELPDKDKDMMLPLFPLKGWGASVKLANSIERISSSIAERMWVADIDKIFLGDCQRKVDRQQGVREVHEEVLLLSNPENGYQCWYEFLAKIPAAIPALQLGDLSQLDKQLQLLESLGRGVVVRLPLVGIEGYLPIVLNLFSMRHEGNFLILLDLDSLDHTSMEKAPVIIGILKLIRDALPNVGLSISGSSFPGAFSKQYCGENPIYERKLFNIVRKDLSEGIFIYSDHGGARVEKNNGGGAYPPPRIDYPLLNDWQFLRREFSDPNNPLEGEKERLYTEIAKEMIQMEYWQGDLRLWGTHMIELTSQGEGWGIKSPSKATAVRLNIHMHRQLCYDTPEDLMDTDEDWTD